MSAEDLATVALTTVAQRLGLSAGMAPTFARYRKAGGTPSGREIMASLGVRRWDEVASRLQLVVEPTITPVRRRQALAAIRAAAKACSLPDGFAPSWRQYEGHAPEGAPDGTTVLKWCGLFRTGYGAWSRAMRQLGFEPAPIRKFARRRMDQTLPAKLRGHVERVARHLGLPPGVAPSAQEYNQVRRLFGYWSAKTISRALTGSFGWAFAMQRMGLVPKGRSLKPSERECVADIRRVAIVLGDPGRMPTQEQYGKWGKYHRRTVLRMLASAVPGWRGVALRCQLQWDGQTPASRVTNEHMIALYREAVTRHGPLSSNAFYRTKPGFSLHLVRMRFGSWPAFLAAAEKEAA